MIIRGGIGVDNIDVAYAEKNHIEVRNTPLASAASVAELAIGHMFSLARHIYAANVTMRAGAWEKKQYAGIELGGKALGLIGMGRIARHTAKLASGLGMRVIYTNTSGPDAGNSPAEYAAFDELASTADFISLHTPKLEKPLIGAAELEKMKDGVFIINTARAALIDMDALLAGLDSGKVAAAALDVYEEEPTADKRILEHPRISMTPHIGASTWEAQKRVGGAIVEIVREAFGEA